MPAIADALRKHQASSIWFHLTLFRSHAQMALRLRKSSPAFFQHVEDSATRFEKRLTFVAFQTNNGLSTCIFVLVDKK
jgi:hypothetical protein